MRRLLALPLLAVAIAPLAGCGEDASESRPLVAAADQTANEKSARWDLTMALDTKREGRMRMDGTMVAAADSSRMRMKVRAEVGGEGPIPMELISIQDEFWIRSPRFSLPPGKQWVHSVDRTVAPRTMTMREFLDLIRESDDVEEVGGERVGGRATTHYKAKVSIDDLFEKAPEEAQDRLREQFEPYEGRGIEFPIEVWIDGDGLVRRILIAFSGGGESLRLDAEILDYGVNVPAAPPSERIVVEEDALGG